MGDRCKQYPNCIKLRDRFGVPANDLYTYIRVYNNYASRNNLPIIRNDVNYSDEQLDEIYKNISNYRSEKIRNPKFARNEQKSLIKSYGSPESYATSMIQASRLNGDDIIDLRHEIAGNFISLISNLSQKYNCSAEEFIKRVGINNLLSAVKKNFINKISKDLKDIEDSSTSDYDKGRLADSIELGRKFLPINDSSQDLFNELCILTIPLINDLYDINIQSDFTLKENDIKQNDIALDITDKEEPIRESWQDNVNSRPAEGSVSPIIRRIIQNTPKVIIKNIPHYFIDDREVNPNSLSMEDRAKINAVEFTSERVIQRGKIFGNAMFTEPSQEIRRLFGILDGCIDEDDMMFVLKGQEKYQDIYDFLSTHERERTTFFANFNKYHQDMFAISMSENGDGTYTMRAPNLTDESKTSRVERYLSDLMFNRPSVNSFYINNIIYNVNEDGEENLGKKNSLRVNYKKFSLSKNWFERKSQELPSLVNSGRFHDATNALSAILDSINIPCEISTINEIVQNTILLNSIIENVRSFYERGEQEFLVARNPMAKDIIQLFRNDNKFREYLNDILEITNKSDVMTQSNIGTVKYCGSTISTRLMPSAITSFIKKLHNYSGNDLLNWLNKEYLDGDQFYNEGTILNRWLQDFYQSADVTKENNIKNYFSLSRNLGIGDVQFENISDRNHMLSFLFQYLQHRSYGKKYIPVERHGDTLYSYNNNTNAYDIEVTDRDYSKRYAIVNSVKTVRFNKKGELIEDYRDDKAMIPLFITGDTNALRLFTTMHYYDTEVYDGMYNLYISDKKTQNIVKAMDKNGIVISANAKETLTKRGNDLRYGILEFLNSKKWRDRLKSIEKDGVENLVASKEDFAKLAKDYLEEEFDKFYEEKLESLGVLDKTDSDKYVYFDRFLSESNGDLREMLKEFFFDYKFGLYNQINIQHVTPMAFNGVEDLQKRNKVVATNGTSLSYNAKIDGKALFSEDNFAQRVVYFKDVFGKIDNNTASAIKRFMLSQYKDSGMEQDQINLIADRFINQFSKCSLTDGEAYRLFDSYRAVLASAGKTFWSDAQEKAYFDIDNLCRKIREENRNATVDEIQEIENNLVAMQPIKPVNDGIETIQIGNSTVKIGFQFKYAEIPLIPEMYPIGSKIREMGEWMRNNKVDMMCSDKCLKKGSFGEVDLQFKSVDGKYVDANGNVLKGMSMNGDIITDDPTMAQQRRYIETTNDDRRVEYDDNVSFKQIMDNQISVGHDGMITGINVHNISYNNYLIQNNVPDHSDGDVIVGTQSRKIIGSLIKFDKDYTVNISGTTKVINGEELFRVYNALHTAKYFKSFIKFANLMNDNERLSRNIAHTIINNGRSNFELLERIALDESGNPFVPYSEISSQQDLINSVISLFKKGVIRQQIAGGNIVQASSMGVGPRALVSPDLMPIVEGDVVTGMEAEMPFAFSVQTDDGIIVPLKYNDYCNDDGTFKPGNNGGETLIEEDYPGILDMIMYRIPTEGAYSMYRVHVKRVTPKSSANTIKLPVICTKISDFDFDIDKLMFMRRSYKMVVDKVVKLKDDDIDTNIWNKIYDKHNADVYLKLKEASRENGLELFRKTGDRSKLTKEVLAIAEEKNIDIKDLRLNQLWPLTDIMMNKSELYNKYAEKVLGGYHIEGSTFDLNTDGSNILNLSKDAIDNAIIDISQSVMSSESTMEERLTPGGFEIMSEDGRVIRVLQHRNEIPELDGTKWKTIELTSDKNLIDFVEYIRSHKDIDYKDTDDYSDPMTSIKLKQLNQVAGEEIGIFANDNVNDAISKRLQVFEIKKGSDAILFGSLIDQKADIDGTYEYNDKLGRSFLFNRVNGRVISKSLHELLGSSVDAVKDNALVAINLNSITGDMGALLVRLGYSTFDIGLLFNQPIIKKLCREMSLNGEKNATKALNRIIRQYSSKKNVLSDPISKQYVTSHNLALNISGKEDNETQINVARLFNKILLVKQEVSDYVQQTRNTSANTVKTDIGKYLSGKMRNDKRGGSFDIITIKANDDLDYPITEDFSNLENLSPKEISKKAREFMDKYKNHPFQYENAVYNIINASMEMIMKKYTPYESDNYKLFRGNLTEYMAPWGLSGEYINQLHQFIPAITLRDLDGDFNPNAINNPLNVSNKEYYLKHIIDILLDAQSEGLNDSNQLMSALKLETVGFDDIGNPLYSIGFKYPSKNLTPIEKYSFTLGWDDIMRKGGKIAEFGKALYLHYYYLHGLSPDTNSLMSVAPTSVLDSLVADQTNNTSYLDTYDEEFNNYLTEEDIRGKTLEFMIYHSKDNKIVPTMPWHLSDVSEDKETGSIIVSGYYVDDVKMMAKDNVDSYFRPLIRVDGALYILSNQKDYKYHTGDIVNNILPSKSQPLIYTRVTVEASDDFREFSSYHNDGNNYLFEDFEHIPVVDAVENPDDDGIIGENLESDSDPKEAAKIAALEPESTDSRNLTSCKSN